MTHPTNLEYLANDKIRGMRAEGLRSQQLRRRSRRATAVRRMMLATAGAAAVFTILSWLL